MKTSLRHLANSQNPGAPALLNLGCGQHYHPAWINVDLHRHSSQVQVHDLRRPLPFTDGQFDAVYHSHVLEHLPPEAGDHLVRQCWRVLKPGGILRIVVPDLERIAQLYLEMLEQAWQGNQKAAANYDWMKLEMLDQMVRAESGGMMGRYMAHVKLDDADFVRERVGTEFWVCRQAPYRVPIAQSRWRHWLARCRLRWRTVRERLVLQFIAVVLGSPQAQAAREGWFRSDGEVHRWMYDRFALRRLCDKHGFVDFTILSAAESQIPHFSEYGLDAVEGAPRKPDSMFVECRKPPAPLAAVHTRAA